MGTEWAMDITHGTEPPCFVPIDGDDIVWGMNMLQARCPGKLVAVIHEDGQDAVEAWVAANPDWHERHRKPDA